MPLRLVSQEELPAPLSGYRLIERLGRGGFGEVWKVEAPGGLYKAAKFVFGDLQGSDEQSRPAEQELKALRRVREIRHPYVLSLERFDTIEGQLIIVMELADRNLWDRFRECRARGLGGIPRGELLRYMEEAAEAIDLMNIHYQIQHLDIKPQNLFLVANHVKVGDFGLAKLLDGMSATVTGGVTPVYAAPETFEGRVTRFCDQYSLAIVYQELLTGTRPFHGTNTRQLLMQHLSGTPDVEPLPEGDREVIRRALRKVPEERWPSCMEMVQALRASGEGRIVVATGADVPDAEQEARTRPTPPPTHAVSSVGAASALATRMAPPGAGGNPPEAVPPGTVQPPASPAGRSASGVPSAASSVGVPSPVASPRAPGSSTAALITPRLVTPSTLTTSQSVTRLRQDGLGSGPPSQLVNAPRSAPPERTGSGVLIPAGIIGLGTNGLRVVEAFQSLLQQRYSDLRQLPHLRWLGIDTDPQAISSTLSSPALPVVPTPSPGTTATPTQSVLMDNPWFLARLQRPAHYLQHPHLPSVEQWLPPGSLARLGRQPAAAQGMRAFGRLALLDHSRPLLLRLRRELDILLSDQPLQQAAAHTGLTLRSNHPHFFLIADLGGGSGSGMFLELAYWLRRELRRLGCQPRLHALLLLPPADPRLLRSPQTSAALGNACAALRELEYCQSGRGVYETHLDNDEGSWRDSEPPFTSLHFLVRPLHSSSPQQQSWLTDAAYLLFLHLFTPLGRYLQELPRPAFPSAHLAGLYRFDWPRRELLDAAAHRLARLLLQRWNAQDSATYEALRPLVAGWLEQQWSHHGLTTEQLVAAFRHDLTLHLGDDPDRYCDALLQSLRTHTPSASKVDAFAVCQVLDQILRLVGKPQVDPQPEADLRFPQPICDSVFAATYERLLRECDAALSVLAVQMLEMPGYRFAGAEEALRQIEQRWDVQIAALEQTHQDLQRQVRQLYQRLLHLIAQLEQGGTLGLGLRRSALVQEILESLRLLSQRQLQCRIVERLLPLLRHQRDAAPEFLRDLALCRQALRQLGEQLDRLSPASTAPAMTGRRLLPYGATDVPTAADRLLQQLLTQQPALFDSWEPRLQQALQRKFRGLGNVCLKVAAKGADFAAWLLEQCRAVIDPHLPRHDPAAAFFECFPPPEMAENALREAVDEAAPDLPAAHSELASTPRAVALLPSGQAGERLRQILTDLRPDLPWHLLTAAEDLCLYREEEIPLTALPHLGPLGQQAYEQLLASDHPPHSRADVPWTQPPNAFVPTA
ncbi:MAG: tubulin-like doman-containing protein [Thermogemmata sp.]|uniref:non-specific serine/threonine protein kinase n=1 Tax=Thermogemmata fonticola TaxID=2755323 RepID=A0A7V8VF99_9BACT|nr:tubulin-like doman-containing protein [Thermogemmata fonticola]MBA2226906.1 protein kinase [Thermogemmata fonticola]MCX8140280.1 protein kinase [Gemmataceae bacterium]